MLYYIFLGGGFAFAASVQPGPLQAFLLARAAADGWKRTLPAAFAPLLSDGPIALLVFFMLGRLPFAFQRMLRAAGGFFLLYLAWAAFRKLREPAAASSNKKQYAARTMLQAAMVNVLNPNPYLAWALVLGPAVVRAWQNGPSNAIALIVAFYGTMVSMLAGFIILAASARQLGRRGQRALAFAAALILASLGIYQIVASFLLRAG
ncbi:MAG: LysE family transporter [Candidatus Aminicenantes bacterium]|nr:LysE family transporter [Candidatus Aminicenantes bacterium]